MDQGRHWRFAARVLQPPGSITDRSAVRSLILRWGFRDEALIYSTARLQIIHYHNS